MFKSLLQPSFSALRRGVSGMVLLAFLLTGIIPPTPGFAQTIFSLPAPGSMVNPTAPFMPPTLRGITVHPDNPLKFDFILDSGDVTMSRDELKNESAKLVRYFLSSLTIPEKDLWVNLSPYEKDRIVPLNFGITEMGRDLLAQDYILKQLTATLIYPEEKLGQEFWTRVYKRAQELYGTTQVPVNTFNKVWVVPQKAVIYEQGNTAYVVYSHLKVMLEEDYKGVQENIANEKIGTNKLMADEVKRVNNASSQVVREVIIPEIEREVNAGKNFASLRQIYYSLILATWYKQNLRHTLLSRVYVNQGKVDGVTVEDKDSKEKIYQQYLAAFQKGVYNYIREDVDPATGASIPRKYFSGGVELMPVVTPEVLQQVRGDPAGLPPEGKRGLAEAMVRAGQGKSSNIEVALAETNGDAREFLGNVQKAAEASRPSGQQTRPLRIGQIGRRVKINSVAIGSHMEDLAKEKAEAEAVGEYGKEVKSDFEKIKSKKMAFKEFEFDEHEIDPRTGKFVSRKFLRVNKFESEKKPYLRVESRLRGGGTWNYQLNIQHVHYMDKYQLNDIIKNLADPQAEELVKNILMMLPRDLPIWQYFEVHEDLLGFASRTKETNLIALHEDIDYHPVAVFHEAGEYLLQDTSDAIGHEKLDLELVQGLAGNLISKASWDMFGAFAGGELIVRTSSGRVLGRVQLGWEAMKIALKDRTNPHYLLRALQRQIFRQRDRELTDWIQQTRKKASQKTQARELYARVVNKIPLEDQTKWKELIADISAVSLPDFHLQWNVKNEIIPQLPLKETVPVDYDDPVNQLYRGLRVLVDAVKAGDFDDDSLKPLKGTLLDGQGLRILLMGHDEGRPMAEGHDPEAAVKLFLHYLNKGEFNSPAARSPAIDKFFSLVKGLSAGRSTDKPAAENWHGLRFLLSSADLVHRGLLDIDLLTKLMIMATAPDRSETLKGVFMQMQELAQAAHSSKQDQYAALFTDPKFLDTFVFEEEQGDGVRKFKAIMKVMTSLLSSKYLDRSTPQETADFLKKIMKFLSDDALNLVSVFFEYSNESNADILDMAFLQGLAEDHSDGALFILFDRLIRAGVLDNSNKYAYKHVVDELFSRTGWATSASDVVSALSKLAFRVRERDLNRNVLHWETLRGLLWGSETQNDIDVIEALQALAQTVKDEGLDEVILKLEYLKHQDNLQAFSAMTELAKSVKAGKSPSVVLREDLLQLMLVDLRNGFWGASLLQVMGESGRLTEGNVGQFVKFIKDLRPILKQYAEATANNSSDQVNVLKLIYKLFRSHAAGAVSDEMVDFDFLIQFFSRPDSQIKQLPNLVESLDMIAQQLKTTGLKLEDLDQPAAPGRATSFRYALAVASLEQLKILSVYFTRSKTPKPDIAWGLLEWTFGLPDSLRGDFATWLITVDVDLLDSGYFNEFFNLSSVPQRENGIEILQILAHLHSSGELKPETRDQFKADLIKQVDLFQESSGPGWDRLSADPRVQLLKILFVKKIARMDNLAEIGLWIKDLPQINEFIFVLNEFLLADILRPDNFSKAKQLNENLAKFSEVSLRAVSGFVQNWRRSADPFARPFMDLDVLIGLLARVDNRDIEQVFQLELRTLIGMASGNAHDPALVFHRDILGALFLNSSEPLSLVISAYKSVLAEAGGRGIKISYDWVMSLLDGLETLRQLYTGDDPLQKYLTALKTALSDSKISPRLVAVKRMLGENLSDDGFMINFYLLPAGIMNLENFGQWRDHLREALKTVTPENYLSDDYLALLFTTLRQDVAGTAGLGFDEFSEVARGARPNSRYASMINAYLQRHVFGEEHELTAEQQDMIIALGVDLSRRMMKLVEESKMSSNLPTFRELTRFNRDFSRFYQQDLGFRNVLEYFILTAANIYGRVLDDEQKRAQFRTILRELLTDHRELLSQAQIHSEGIRGDLDQIIDRIIRYGDYEHLHRDVGPDEVPALVGIRASIERARQAGSASLLIVDDDNAVMVDEVLSQMEGEADTVLVRLPMNGFSRRQELFGMYLPKQRLAAAEIDSLITGAQAEDIQKALKDVLGLKDDEVAAAYEEWLTSAQWNDNPLLRESVALHLKNPNRWKEFMIWQDGLLVRLRDMAKKNPKQKFLIAMENISAAPDGVRLLLNPVLWERTVEIPEKGQRLELPENLNFILTMHKGTVIRDESFMNRPLVQYIPEFSIKDVVKFMKLKTGLEDSDLNRLIEYVTRLENLRLQDKPSFHPHHFLEIARRVKGVMQETGNFDGQLALKEFYNYVYLLLRSEADRKILAQAFLVDMTSALLFVPAASVDAFKGTVRFDEVEVKVSDEFTRYARENKDKNFVQIMNDLYGYIVTEMELRVLAQLARIYKGYGSKTIQLEGPSGEGKTEIGRIFARLVGYRTREHTVNEDTNLAEFRGQIRPTRDGRYELHESGYVSQLAEGGNVFLFNEINTNEAGALYYWLFPEMSGRARKTLGEFVQEGQDTVVKTARVSQNNLWLFTINPQAAFQGRGITPPIVSSMVTTFYMAQDSGKLPKVIRGHLQRNGLAKRLSARSMDFVVQKLADVHLQLKQFKEQHRLLSNQDVTPRHIIQVTERFKEYLAQQMDPRAAFQRAVEEIYVYSWQRLEDVALARQAVYQIFGKVDFADPQSTLRAALGQKTRPVLIFTNAMNDLRRVKLELRAVDPAADIEEVPLSYFHRRKHFLGGLMPGGASSASGPEARLSALRSPLDEEMGILASLIKRARLTPGRTLYAVLYDYTHMNPQSAPLLNEFFQTGRIDGIDEIVNLAISEKLFAELAATGAWEALRQQYAGVAPQRWQDFTDKQKLSFARWFYGERPDNLRFVATGSAVEKINLSPAEINRFVPVNIAEKANREHFENYARRRMAEKLKDHESLIMFMVGEAFDAYERQLSASEYQHNRLGVRDVNVFLAALAQREQVDEDFIRKMAFYIFGIGLRSSYRKEYVEKIGYADQMDEDPGKMIRYTKRAGGVYIIVDGIEFKTKLADIPQTRFLAPTKTSVRQLASLLLGLKTSRPIIIEGYPGGGKTSSAEDLARRLGLDFYKDVMYEDIDLGEFLGRLSKEGQQFLLTALKKDALGHHVVKFLRAYAEGGIELLDEGAMGVNSQQIISYLSVLAQLPQIDLGVFHPGLAGTVIKRHKDFHLIIAQNPASSTLGREPILYDTDTTAHKIWTDNQLDQADALRIIDYYLDDPAKIPTGLKDQIAEIHRSFTDIHPRSEELSPRQLITIVRIINQALAAGRDLDQAAFEGVMVAYLTGVDKSDFQNLWKVVDEKSQGRFSRYMKEWEEPIKVTPNDDFVQFNGWRLPRSATSGNVSQDDVEIIEDLPFQSQGLRAMALGVSMKMPVVLLEQSGADAADLVKKFAHLTGYEMHTLWSHHQMTRMHLLSSLMPKFEAEMDRYGIRREEATKEFLMNLGFISRFLMQEGEYAAMTPEKRKTQAQQILFFHMMDAIPERQRVMLNELLTTGRIQLLNERGESVSYVLPQWVHIVASSSLEHKFSSAFINRFLPVQVTPLDNLREVTVVVQNRYPLVRAEEVAWIQQAAWQVFRKDKQMDFALHYGFSPRDVMKLARLIQLEKQRDIAAGKFNDNPFYYALKAMFIIYGLGMSEGDVKIFEQRVVIEGLLKPLLQAGAEQMYLGFLKKIKEELTAVTYRSYTVRMDIAQMGEGEGQTLANGINVIRKGDGFVIATAGANVYQVNDADLQDWFDLTKNKEEILLRREGDQLVFQIRLLESIGGMVLPRDEFNRMRSLPEDEVPTNEFIRATEEIRLLLGAQLRGWQVVEDNLGRRRAPRVLMLNGTTGTAKTTVERFLARLWGVPLYILNSSEDIRVSDVTVGLKLEEGKFQIGVKEFLARVGKINGKRISLPSRAVSNRTILMIDEANASPELLMALAPLFRGEKKFNIEYAGESFEVEVDDEVMVVLTFNPAETYAGRGTFAPEITAHAEKLWAPNPMNYSDLTLIDILREYHRRGITKTRRELKKALPLASAVSREGFEKVEPVQTKVEDREHPPVVAVSDLKVDDTTGEQKPAPAPAQPPAAQMQKVSLSYDVQAIEANARAFTSAQGHAVFVNTILRDYLLALANGHRGLEDVVLRAASALGADVVQVLQEIITMYDQNLVKESALKEKFLDLRRVFVQHDVALFLKMVEKQGRPYILLFVEDIRRRQRISAAQLQQLGEDPQNYTGTAAQALVVPGTQYSRPGVSGFFEGEFAFAFESAAFQEIMNNIDTLLPGVDSAEFVDWIAMHELGHVMDNLRLRARGYKIPRGIRWTRLARDVNAAGIGLWMSENLELNSMLFPMFLSPKAREYVLYELVNTLRKQKDAKSYYSQAAKGILNGILIKFKGDQADLITDSFEDDRITAAADIVKDMTSEELNALAAEFYQDPKRYLATAKAGVYKGQVMVGSGGDSVQDISMGVDGTADVEMEYKDGEGGVQVDTPEQEGKGPKIIKEPKSGGQGPGGEGAPGSGPEEEGDKEGQGDGSGKPGETPDVSGVKGDIMKLLKLSPGLISRYLETFAGTSKTLKVFSESGDEVEMERVLTEDMEPFYRQKIIQALASLSSGVTVDISGSTHGYLLDQFVKMARYFSSLSYYAAVRNKEAEFSLSAFGTEFHSILEFKDSRNKLAIEEAISRIPSVQDSGGTEIHEALEGIKKKYADQTHKKYKMEIIFTDGASGSVEASKELAKEIERELGVDILFIGLNTPSVADYPKHLNLPGNTSPEKLVELIIKLSLVKVSRGMLPVGDLSEFVRDIVESVQPATPEDDDVFLDDLLAVSQDAAMLGRNDARPAVRGVQPMTADTTPVGGIDLNPAHFDLEIRRDAQGVPLSLPMQPVESIKIDGFIPVIINVTPITTLPFQLGQNQPGSRFDLSSIK